MNNPGWLDVHGHFYPPMADEQTVELSQLMQSYGLVVKDSNLLHWDPKKYLEYNQSANVRMQLLSFIPPNHVAIQKANDYAHSIVQQWPTHYGHLGALPTDDAKACLEEIKRLDSYSEPGIDGYAVSTIYNDIYLSDPKLNPVYEELNRRSAVLHIHPVGYCVKTCQPSLLLDVVLETGKVASDMLYKGVFKRYPNIRFILAHCGGTLPVLSGRISLLAAGGFIPNPENLSRAEIEQQLSRLYVDTAASVKTALGPAAKMVGIERCIYGSDCGVPCSNEMTMNENQAEIAIVEKELGIEVGTVQNASWKLFPAAAKRAGVKINS